MNDPVEELIAKAVAAKSADEALKYSQAALNAANAIGRQQQDAAMHHQSGGFTRGAGTKPGCEQSP